MMTVVIAEAPCFAARGLAAMRAAGWACELYLGTLDTLPARLADADGAIVRFGLRWSADRLRRASGRLRFIAVPATGTDHIDRGAAAALAINIISLAGHPGLREVTATPEHAFGLMLALLRNTVPAHQSVVMGQWNRNAFLGRQVRGLAVGVVGLGRTGRAFADMAAAFGARVAYFDPYVAETRFARCTVLEELARGSDVIAVHAALNDETHGLLGAAFFAALKPGSFLVNTARGTLMDETELLCALASGRLAGAALDVVCNEPEQGRALESPLRSYASAHPNLILTPHIGGATGDSIRLAEELLAERLVEDYGPPLSAS